MNKNKSLNVAPYISVLAIAVAALIGIPCWLYYCFAPDCISFAGKDYGFYMFFFAFAIFALTALVVCKYQNIKEFKKYAALILKFFVFAVIILFNMHSIFLWAVLSAFIAEFIEPIDKIMNPYFNIKKWKNKAVKFVFANKKQPYIHRK